MGKFSKTKKTQYVCCNKCIDEPEVHSSENYDCPPNYKPKKCKRLTEREICVKYGPAVVSINTQTNLTTETCSSKKYPRSSEQGFENGLTYGEDFITYQTQGNGVFIENHLILCPASLVTISPNITQRWNQYPFCDNEKDRRLKGKNSLRVDRILVTVYNLNGSKHSFVYQAQLLGLYGLGDFALLYIDMNCFEFNKCNPCILECHPYFKFGCSRAYKCGEDVYSIGDIFRRSSFAGYEAVVEPIYIQGEVNENLQQEWDGVPGVYPQPLQQFGGRFFAAGKVSNHRAMDPQGLYQGELFVVDMNIYAYAVGAPFINKFGKLVGLQTMNVTGGVSGVSNITLIPTLIPMLNEEPEVEPIRNIVEESEVVEQNLGQTQIVRIGQAKNGDGIVAGPSQFFMQKIINKLISSINSGSCKGNVKLIESPYGNFRLCTHGYLGISWKLVSAQDFTSWYYDGQNLPDYYDGEWGSGPVSKEVMGIRITGFAGGDSMRCIVVPGSSTPGTVFGSFVNSNADDCRGANLMVGDIITHINCKPIGTLGVPQISPLLVTSRKSEGDCVQLTVTRQCTGFCDSCNVTVQLERLPNFVNWPWYKYPDQLLNTVPTSGPWFVNEYPRVDGLGTFYPSF